MGVSMSNLLLSFLLILAGCQQAGAQVSSINPNIPAQNSPLTSPPIRGNFTAAFNDVNTIYGLFGTFPSFTHTWTALQTFGGGAIVPTRSPGDNTTNAASTAFAMAAAAAVTAVPATGTACPALTVTGTPFTNTSGAPTGTTLNVWDGTQCITWATLNQSAHTLKFGSAQCPLATAMSFGCVEPDGVTITAAGGVISSIGSATTSVLVGTTNVISGTGGALLYDNAGVLATSVNDPLNIVRLGADPTGMTDATSIINNALALAVGSTSGSRGDRSVYFPCGIFSVTGITLPGSSSVGPGIKVYGDGVCSNIHLASGHPSANIFTVGSGTVNDTDDVLISDLQISSAAQQTAGAYLYTKGAARPRFKNLYMEDGHAYNGLELDGVDFANVNHVVVLAPANVGIKAYDGFDCGVTPVTKITNATTASGSAVIHLSNTSGISVGMSAYDITLGPNTALPGTVTSLVANTSVTMTSPVGYSGLGNGDSVVFGIGCGGVGLTFDGDTTITGAGLAGVHVSGGVGGVYANSLHVYTSGNAFITDTNASSGIQNREFFFGPSSDFDSNIGFGLSFGVNSFSYSICTGCWIGAGGSGGVLINSQTTQINPVETGAIVKFTGCKVGQNNGIGINWKDQGTLTVDGCDLSYNFGGTGIALNIQGTAGVGQVVASNNLVRGNSVRPLAAPTAPQNMTFVGNNWTNNPFGPSGVTPGANVICVNNLGGSAGC